MKSYWLAAFCVGAVACSGVGADDAANAPNASEGSTTKSAVTTDVHAAVVAHVEAKRARLGGWANVRVSDVATPVFEPGADAPAFYEVPLFEGNAERGYVIARAQAPYEVVQYTDRGEGPAVKLVRDTRVARVYRLDMALYVGEDKSGNLTGSSHELSIIEHGGDKPTVKPISWAEAKLRFPQERARVNAHVASLKTQSWWDDYFGGPPAATCTVNGLVPPYNQLQPGEGPNDTACWSGCGPTAWAMIFGWASMRAAQSSDYAAYAGLVRGGDDFSGDPVAASGAQDDTANRLMMTLNRTVSTSCSSGVGSTTFWDMGHVSDYIASRAPGIAVDLDYNLLTIPMPYLRDAVVNTVCADRPAIVSAGTFVDNNMHFPVAWAYDTGWFYLNMGWGGAGDAWYTAETYFFASIHAQ